jgi:ATP-dependent DNA helicase RecG
MKSKKLEQLRKTQGLNLPIAELRGVGPKRAVLLAQKGLNTVLDLFLFIPIRYEDRTRVTPINKAEEGNPVLVKGMIVYGKEEGFYPSRKRVFRIIIEDESDTLELIWFQYRKPHLVSFAKTGTELLAYGSIRVNRDRRQMVHPDVTVIDSREVNKHLGFYPVYSTVPGISGNFIRYLIRSSFESYLQTIVDPIPRNITSSLDLPGLSHALNYVHFPSGDSSIEQLITYKTPFHKRLMFDQFFLTLLAIFYRKRKREMVKVQLQKVPENLIKQTRDFFQFSLTSHQLAAIEDMAGDFQQGRPMNRLLMGDVGCGKTIVAVVAIYITLLNGRQAAIMAPTQILAEQHFQYISALPKDMGFRSVLVTGKFSKSDRKNLYEQISNGSYNVIIGTHVIIQEDLSFSDLGLVVIDEQHRFGVRQRALIERKGKTPHLLVMTATPIPRTLAITA